MTTAASLLAVGLAFSIGCGSGGQKSEPDAGSREPAVVVDGSGLQLSGTRLSSQPSDRLERIDPLYQKLDETRGPGATSENLAVQLPADTSCLAGLSVLQTAALGGRTSITLTLGDRTHEIVMTPAPREAWGEDLPAPLRGSRLTFPKRGPIEVLPTVCGSSAYDRVEPEGVPAALDDTASLFEAPLGRLMIACELGVSLGAVMAVHERLKPRSLALGVASCDRWDRETLALDPQPSEDRAHWGAPLDVGSVVAPPSDPLPGSGEGKPPTTEIGEVKVRDQDRVTPETVRRALEGARPHIASCYHRALSNNRSLRGRVLVTGDIGKLGLTRLQFAGGDLPSEDVVRCTSKMIFAHASFSPATKLTQFEAAIDFSPG